MGICFECRVTIDGEPHCRSCQIFPASRATVTVAERPDIAIIGAGPAGIAAAVRARECGASVLIIDDNPSAGGQIWRGSQNDSKARTWSKRFSRSEPPSIFSARVVAVEPDPLKLVVENADRAFEISPRKLILASGARELFLPFPGWTLRGVMGVGGLQAMAKSGLPIAGKKVVVAGTGPLLLAVADYLRKHGAQVKLIAEQASSKAVRNFAAKLIREPGKAIQAGQLRLALRGIPYLQDCWVEQAHGDGPLRSVTLRQGTNTWTEECDYAAIAYGLCPNTELAALIGCKVSSEAIEIDELQRTSVNDVFACGECTGIGGVDLSLAEGEIAGYTAAGQIRKATARFGKRALARKFAEALNATFALRDQLKQLPRTDTIVCRCEDVRYHQLKDVHTFREAKLHTRCGMGPCQGRVCGPAAGFLFGWHMESIRPPVFPARLSTLATTPK